MINDMDGQKAKLKETVGKEIDEYFERLAVASNQEGFDINKMEQLMVESQRKLKTALNEANSGLASACETDVKKTARNAETHWKGQRGGNR